MTHPKSRSCFGSGAITFIGAPYGRTYSASGYCCVGGVAAEQARAASVKPCALTLKKVIG
jgi:hypothetical protein